MNGMQRPFIVRLSLILSLFAIGNAAVFEHASDLNVVDFDFIVVGGGNAGNVIANRLTENPAHNVLLIEAGPSYKGALKPPIPFLCTKLAPSTPYDWNYTTVSQPGLGGRSVPYPRGHILGGSSAINYMIYTRGTTDDFNRYASVSGDPGWSWENMMPYFLKNEKFGPPADGHNTSGQYDPSVHGTDGMNSVSLPGYPSAIDSMVIDAAHQLGGDFAFNLDMNSGDELGFGWVQTTTDGPRRSSSATSYLAPEYLSRPNLFVLVNTQVSRLLQSGSDSGVPAFRGVEFRTSTGLLNYTASKEVILSAGAVGSPHILLNSGIGDSAALNASGITPLVNLTDVGQNLSDHPFISSPWSVTGNDTFENYNRNITFQALALAQWALSGTGLLTDTVVNQIGFMRLPSDHPIFETSPDPANGPNTPHMELLFANGIPMGPVPATGHYLAIGAVAVQPTSRGTITVNSSNPFDAPLIDPGILTTEFDKITLREAVKSSMKFLTAPAWDGYIIGRYGPFANATTDQELDAYIAANTGTIFHPVGTASMSPWNVSYGVVNPDLTVKGIAGLRVVDASVLPFVPSAHTQAPVYAVAERASDLIKASYNSTSDVGTIWDTLWMTFTDNVVLASSFFMPNI